MSTQPFAFEAFREIDDPRVEPDSEAVESLDAIRGVLFGIAVCTPFWAVVYWMLS